jgi:uncharacterized DUF497 family protein
VEYEWDPAKAQANLRKHGVTFEFATHAFRDSNRIERPDESDHYGEERWLVIGRADKFVLMVVFTFRSDITRIISARRATRNEFIEYWNGQIPV